MTDFSVRDKLMRAHPVRLYEDAKSALRYVIFENFEYNVYAFLIILGGFLVGWIVYKLILYCGLPSSLQAHFRLAKSKTGEKRVESHESGKVVWKNVKGQLIEQGDIENQLSPDSERPLFYSARSSVVHFVALILKIVIILFGFYAGFFVIGVSFFNLAMSLGVIGILVTYSFSSPISSLTGAFVMFGTGQWVEGMVAKVGAHKGAILHTSSMFTTLNCKEEATGRPYLAIVPNRYFNDDIVLRFPEEEPGMEGFDTASIESQYVRAPAYQKRSIIIKQKL